MKKKKILLISQHFYPEIGSAGNRIKNIFELLTERGYHVFVLTTEPTYPNRELYSDSRFWNDEQLNRERNIHRVSVKNRKYARTIWNRLIYYLEIMLRFILFILTDQRKYDVVFVSSPPIFIGFTGMLAKRKYRAKLVLDVRDLWPESLKGVNVFNNRLILAVFQWLEKKLYNESDHIVINSLGFLEHICTKSSVPAENVSFIPNAAREVEIIDRHSRKPPRFSVVYAGNIGLAQDSLLLMELAEELRKHEITISVVGYGLRRKQFADFVKVNNLNNVKIMPALSRKECLEFIATHQAAIVTLNSSEVFKTVLPGKIIDYMTCGVPIVAAVSGYSKQVIESEQVGFVSENRDRQEMINYILYLKNNPDLAEEMANNCTNYVKRRFRWEKNIERLVDVLENHL
jgi:hypothetical protein